MAIGEVVVEDYSDIKVVRGLVLNKVTFLFFDPDSSRHHTFLNAARASTQYRKDAVTVELQQPIHYV